MHGWQRMSCAASLTALSSCVCELLKIQSHLAVPLGLQMYQPSLDQVEALPLGREQDVTVLGIAFDTQAQVSLPPLISSTCQVVHGKHTPHLSRSFRNYRLCSRHSTQLRSVMRRGRTGAMWCTAGRRRSMNTAPP